MNPRIVVPANAGSRGARSICPRRTRETLPTSTRASAPTPSHRDAPAGSRDRGRRLPGPAAASTPSRSAPGSGAEAERRQVAWRRSVLPSVSLGSIQISPEEKMSFSADSSSGRGRISARCRAWASGESIFSGHRPGLALEVPDRRGETGGRARRVSRALSGSSRLTCSIRFADLPSGTSPGNARSVLLVGPARLLRLVVASLQSPDVEPLRGRGMIRCRRGRRPSGATC